MSFITRVLAGASIALALSFNLPIASANLGGTDDSAAEDPGFLDAVAAIESQDWPKAIMLLEETAEYYPDSADTQNYLGYAYRKSGDLDVALKHYHLALELNPDHKHAHEYLGEAYLMKDDLANAQLHLDQLAKICTPIPCEEYKELKRAVDEYQSK